MSELEWIVDPNSVVSPQGCGVDLCGNWCGIQSCPGNGPCPSNMCFIYIYEDTPTA